MKKKIIGYVSTACAMLICFCLCVCVFAYAGKVVLKEFFKYVGPKFNVTYYTTASATIIGESKQQVGRFNSSTPVTAVATTGYEFVGWSDGVAEATRHEDNVCEDIFVYPICKIIQLDTPIICISTTDGVSVDTREEYVECSISIMNTEGEYDLEGASAKIRGRGNGSWWYDKKSYRIKFDTQISVFGSEYKAKSWALVASHSDKTLSRNTIAYDFAGKMENIPFASCSEYVEVYLNDEYLGVYNFCDQIETGVGRMDISGVDDGSNPGFFVEIEQRASWTGTEDIDYFNFDGISYEIKAPDLSKYNGGGYSSEQFIAYVKNYFSDCYAALDGGDWSAVTELIDVESFAETYFIHEVFGIIDSGYASFYMYKRAGDGKLSSGPVWDFDSSGGNFNYEYATEEECSPEMPLIASILNVWYNKLLEYDEFSSLVSEKLVYYKDAFEETLDLLKTDNPDGIYYKYGRSLERNFEKWETMGVFVYDEPKNVYTIDTVTGQFDFLYNWLMERYAFVCAQYGVA